MVDRGDRSYIAPVHNQRQGISLSRRLLRYFLRVYLCRKYFEMGLANDAARLRTASVRQDQRKYFEMGLANDAATLEMGPGNDAANLAMGLANDAARLRTASVRQDQRKCLRTASVRQDHRKCLRTASVRQDHRK